MPTVTAQVSNPDEIAIVGESAQFEGVRGISHAGNHGAVVGINDNQTDNAGPGVFGESTRGEGVRGVSHSPVHGAVVGTCDNEASGVFGESARGEGVRGVSHSPVHGAVVGTCDNEAPGVFGESTRGEGVRGVSHSAAHGAVVGTNDAAEGVGIFGKGGRLAGQFEGNVEITGKLFVTGVEIASLFRRVLELERVTRWGIPVHGPQDRPSIEQDQRFDVIGKGFTPLRGFGGIVFRILNARTGELVQLVGEGIDPTPASSHISIQKDGTFLCQVAFLADAEQGEELIVCATDGRDDPNDMTGTLWSNTIRIHKQDPL